MGLGGLALAGLLWATELPYETSTRGSYRTETRSVKQYKTGIPEGIRSINSEYEKFRRAKKVAESGFLEVGAVPPAVMSALECYTPDRARVAELDVDNDGAYELSAFCVEACGASGYCDLSLFKYENGWKNVLTFNGELLTGDEIVNGHNVLYEDAITFIGRGTGLSIADIALETGVRRITKHAFDGKKYEAVLSFIPPAEAARRIAEIRYSDMPQEERKEILDGLQKMSNNDAFLAGVLSAYGINTEDTEQLAQSVDALIDGLGLSAQAPDIDFQIAMATRKAILSSPTSLAAYFAGRVVHHATADARYEAEMRERAKWDPFLEEYKRQTGQWPSEERIRRHEMLGGADAIYENEIPDKPFQARDTIFTERSSDGLTERRYSSPGATPEQARQDYRIQQERRNAEIQQNWQQGQERLRQDAGKAVDAARQAGENILQQLQKAAQSQPEKKKD